MKIKNFVPVILTFLLMSSAFANPISNPEKETFRFFINADPQMGEAETKRKNLTVLNSLLADFVSEVNDQHLKDPVEFVVYNGDLVWKPLKLAFENFKNIVAAQKPPAILVHGNHDGLIGDDSFVDLQQSISGYQKLNYTFNYGAWKFIVLSAQEKYPTVESKENIIKWLSQELSEAKDKRVMIMMHYHLMPIGLSQMEFYSYSPMSFRNKILDTISQFGNVKYVFTGHVHTGVKSSIKTTYEYKDTIYVNTPTPVMSRPFGEEFEPFEDKPDDPYYRRGYYLEVKVNGDDVELIGHKINHPFQVVYPKKFKEMKPSMDRRFFISEAETKPHLKLKNPSFNNGLKGWQKSFRYKKDKNNSFVNKVEDGVNILNLKSPWGTWTTDEFMETYQTVKIDITKKPVVKYSFEKPQWSSKGAGGYIRLFMYNDDDEREKVLLFHWGDQQERVSFMYQSWFFNSDGNRAHSNYFQQAMKENNFLSFNLDFDQRAAQVLDVNIYKLLLAADPEFDITKIKKMTIAHGVWTRVTKNELKINSRLNVQEVYLSEDNGDFSSVTGINNKVLSLGDRDTVMPYRVF
jgi:hypothetical protein